MEKPAVGLTFREFLLSYKGFGIDVANRDYSCIWVEGNEGGNIGVVSLIETSYAMSSDFGWVFVVDVTKGVEA